MERLSRKDFGALLDELVLFADLTGLAGYSDGASPRSEILDPGKKRKDICEQR